MTIAISRRAPRRTGAALRHPQQLHVFSFRWRGPDGSDRFATVLVRGSGGETAAIGEAYTAARQKGPAPCCDDIRTVPTPRGTPRLDAICRRHTAFPNFLALTTAAGGYRPSIRLELMGADGLALARAYDRLQAAWRDPRRAFVTGKVERRRPPV